jgi:5'-methylthioadenosine phosphorylase
MGVAIIGGSGVAALPFDSEPEQIPHATGWGDATLLRGTIADRPVLFLPRHGAGHRVPPHRVPYRAHIAALAALGVRAVLGTFAVGSLRADWKPGTLVLFDDLIDFCLTRTGKTFFDGQPDAPVVHADVTRPFSEPLRAVVRQAADTLDLPLEPSGTYLCGDGPRYETAAEVRLFASWGADVVGMTAVPEVLLAREAGLHYAGIGVVTNLGAGIAPEPLRHTDVETAMHAAGPRLIALIARAVAMLEPESLPAIGPGVALPERD